MKDKDMDLARKIRYSMTYEVRKDSEGNVIGPKIKKDSIVRNVKVTPHVPVFITYYTIYPDKNGNMVKFRDVYGYDKRIIKQLKQFATRR